MATMCGVGCAVGEYVGDGQGDKENVAQATTSADLDLDAVDADQGKEDESGSDGEDGVDGSPLHIFYDCETTGLSIYSEHITDIAAKVVACPVPLTDPTFSSLVKTSRYISAAGMLLCIMQYTFTLCVCALSYQGYRHHHNHAAR